MARKYQVDPSSTETVITHSVTVNGDLNIDNDLYIDGKLKGNIICEGNVNIGTNATINGNVKAKNVTAAGTVRGNINSSERLVLRSTAIINGEINTDKLSVEEGALLAGKITMPPAETESKNNNKS